MRVLAFRKRLFLKYKKELEAYGYQVGKISMKEQTVVFNRVSGQ